MQETVFEDLFSEEVWGTTYKDHSDKDINGTMMRVSTAIASVEQTEELRKEWTEKFYDLLTGFKGVAGGRIYANAGTEYSGTTLANCYVGPRGDFDIDSIDGILASLVSQVKTLKSEGGWGENFSYIRPRGTFINGIGVDSPGAVKFMELFDKSSEIITAGSGKKSTNKKAKGKIRKGAMMGVLDIWHPDIIEFITAKQQANRLSKFNISVNVSDEFMERVNALDTNPDAEWDLYYPDTTFPQYKTEWNGDIKLWKGKGYPVVVYNTVKVEWLWNLIMESTYNRAEPGVLFLDRANYFNPLSYGETIYATNPCFVGTTKVLTKTGYRQLVGMVGEQVEIWNGYQWSTVEPKVTAVNQEILDIQLSDGTVLSTTPYHGFILKGGKRVEAHQLSIGDKLEKHEFPVIHGTDVIDNAYSRGVYCGDGTRNTNTVFLFGVKKELLPYLAVSGFSEHSTYSGEDTRLCVNLSVSDLRKDFVPSANHTIESRLQWLSGLIDTDGCVVEGAGQISSIDRDFLMQTKLLLNTLGCNGTVSLMKEGGIRQMPDGKGGSADYMTQDCYRISISATYMQRLVELGLDTKRCVFDHVPQRNAARCVKVVSITKRDGLEPKVYCFNEPKNHSGVFEGIMTAQCGEQTLSPGNICCLGTINLTQFINVDYTGFDLDRLTKYVGYMVRFLDNVNSYSAAPLPEYKESMEKKRRIGCGVMGWGSSLMMMQVRFGSEQADKIRSELMEAYAKAAYMASIDLAVEKGMFEHCIPEKHAEAVFVKNLNLSAEYMDKLRATGIRNAALLSQQPNGNGSIFANVVTGGIEPAFMAEYIRTVIVGSMPDEIAHACPKWFEGEWFETDIFKVAKEGDEEILKGSFNGITYKIDKNRGLTKEVLCEDYGVRNLKKRGLWNPNADWAVTTTQLSADDHVNDLKGFAKMTDAACSKTCNLPYDYPLDKFKTLYKDVYNTGYIKGFTTYRSGTMTSVLSAIDSPESAETEEIILDDVKLAASLPATVKTLKAEGKKYYLTVINDENNTRPVAFFVHTNHHEKTVTTSDAIERLLQLAQDKGIPQKHIDAMVAKYVNDNNVTKIARTISLLLRHGVLIKNVVTCIDKVQDVYVGSFLFAIKKFLATFIKDGEKVEGACEACGGKMVFSEGCSKCTSCGSSKCG